MKIALTDIETTGLDPKEQEIIEIGCVLFDSETFEVIEAFDMKVKPEHIETGQKEAFAVNGYNEAEWIDAMPLKDAMEEYTAKTKGAIFCAYNAIFDWSFLSEAAYNKEVPLLFHYHRYDLLSMAVAKIKGKQSYSMKSVCGYLNIMAEAKMHRALNGAYKEYEVYQALMSI